MELSSRGYEAKGPAHWCLPGSDPGITDDELLTLVLLQNQPGIYLFLFALLSFCFGFGALPNWSFWMIKASFEATFLVFFVLMLIWQTKTILSEPRFFSRKQVVIILSSYCVLFSSLILYVLFCRHEQIIADKNGEVFSETATYDVPSLIGVWISLCLAFLFSNGFDVFSNYQRVFSLYREAYREGRYKKVGENKVMRRFLKIKFSPLLIYFFLLYFLVLSARSS